MAILDFTLAATVGFSDNCSGTLPLVTAMRGTLYVVSTPIGNFEDMTARGLRVLQSVDVVAAEDPSHTKKLFDHYNIQTPLTTYHNLNKEEKTPVLLRLLENGQAVAVVCDAGTPSVNDPGSYLVSRTLKADIPVVPVPGPSATVAALSVSGISGDAFVFHGCLPNERRDRHRVLRAMRSDPRTQVLFESGVRIPCTLSELAFWLGNRAMVLAKDLTRADEHVMAGTAKELREKCGDTLVHGEVTLVVKGATSRPKKQKSRTAGRIRPRRVSGSTRGRNR